MLTKYISCEDCIYKDYCYNFDPFFGCSDGEVATKQSDNVMLN